MYDGRNYIIDPNNGLLTTIGSTLSVLNKEIPTGSLALVTYTANAYRHVRGSMNVTNLALNINWAVLLATPK